MTGDQLKPILEAALLAADRPLSLDHLLALFDEAEQPERKLLREVLDSLAADCEGRGVELREVASGWRYQVRRDYAPWVTRLWEDRPPRYSRALLETLALIAYRQPITRAEIEEIRGVSVSSSIVKTLLEREWVRVVGHRDVPGRPAMYATTRQFLDYFNLKSLEELPPLAAIRDLDVISAELELPLSGEPPMEAGADDLGDEGDEQDPVEDQGFPRRGEA
jgi:segregation and condensation protein B